MIRQKQIKGLQVADQAALTASGIVSPEFAYVVDSQAFWTRIAGVNTRITDNLATGSTAVVAGTSGNIPAPGIGTQNQFLKGDMTYDSAISSWVTAKAYAIGDIIYDPTTSKIYRATTAHTSGATITLGNFSELSSSAAAADRLDVLTPTAQNVIPNLSTIPSVASRVQISVNGIIETSGISVNASGVFTVTPATLGYNIETTDVVAAQYLV